MAKIKKLLCLVSSWRAKPTITKMKITRTESDTARSAGLAKSIFSALLKSSALNQTIDSRSNNYTLIRLVLAASVVYFHSAAFIVGPGLKDPIASVLYPTADVGGLAVQIFFFLSGLFVSQSYAKDPDVFHFVVKRFFRIWPGLFACVATTAVIACISTAPYHAGQFLRMHEFYEYIVHNAFFDLRWSIPGVFDGRKWTAINGAIHTLPLEVKMYAILAACAFIGMLGNKKRSGCAAVLLLIITALPARYVPSLDIIFTADYSRAATAMFFVGVLAFSASHWIRIAAWQGIFIVSILFLTTGFFHTAVFYVMTVWITLFLGQLPLPNLFRPRTDLSYGTYIYGWPMQQLTISAFGPMTNQFHVTGLSLIAAIACASISWRFVEKPSVKLGHRVAGISLRSRGRGLVHMRPTRYETGLGITLAVIFVVCALMLYVTRLAG